MSRGIETREALLDAALAAMSERGFHGTSVPELAERAGVGAATMYRHFDSKEALGNALYLHAKRRFAALLWEGFPDDLPVRKAIREVWSRLVDIVVHDTALVLFLEMQHHETYLTAETREVAKDVVLEPLEAILRRGQAEGIVRGDDVAVLLAFLSGAFHGLAKAAIGVDGKVDAAVVRRGEPLAWASIRA